MSNKATILPGYRENSLPLHDPLSPSHYCLISSDRVKSASSNYNLQHTSSFLQEGPVDRLTRRLAQASIIPETQHATIHLSTPTSILNSEPLRASMHVETTSFCPARQKQTKSSMESSPLRRSIIINEDYSDDSSSRDHCRLIESQALLDPLRECFEDFT